MDDEVVDGAQRGGLAHPEAPILVPESTDVLVAGDVITLEPGAYSEGIGGMRIEHNYLITPTGYERLSNHTPLALAAARAAGDLGQQLERALPRSKVR